MKKFILSIGMLTSVGIFAQTDIKQKVTEGAQEQTGSLFNKGLEGAGESIADGSVIWGIRANALINTSSLGNLSDIKELKDSGFNVGVSAKFNLGSGFFANPELYYTHLGTSRIDLPILFGYNLSETFAVVAGPALMYGFSAESKNEGKNLVNEMINTGTIDVAKLSSNLNFGYQAGLQATISQFVISAKYEGSLSSQVVDLVNTATGQKFEEKVKTSVISLGLGYNF